jgi:UDP-glucuronate decarboxylase
MKTVLITGCAGFIGINLIKRLVETTTDYIIGIDSLITSVDPHITLSKDGHVFGTIPERGCNEVITECRNVGIGRWMRSAGEKEFCRNNADNICERFTFIQCDIVKDVDVLQGLPKIDEIYHFASIASPPKYRKYPIETMNVNIIGTIHMLDLAVKHGAKLLFTSTSEVYGDPLEHPQKETYYGNVNTVGERSCYDESKRCAETYVYEYRRKYTGDFKICRIFNTYGPYMDIDDGRVITNIIKQVIHNRPVVIHGDGNQTRSFCYIDDMLDGLLSFMVSSELGPINLGNPNTECTINNLVRIFEIVIGTKLIVVNDGKMENDPALRRPDIRNARRLLGFYPSVSLEDGLQKTFTYFTKVTLQSLRQ